MDFTNLDDAVWALCECVPLNASGHVAPSSNVVYLCECDGCFFVCTAGSLPDGSYSLICSTTDIEENMADIAFDVSSEHSSTLDLFAAVLPYAAARC